MGELGAPAAKIRIGLTGQMGSAAPLAACGSFAVDHRAAWKSFDNLADRRIVHIRSGRALMKRQFLAAPRPAAPAGARSEAII